MNSLEQRVEGEGTVDRHNDFSVKNERLRLELTNRLDQLGEVTRE
jgi:hypothetical protein